MIYITQEAPHNAQGPTFTALSWMNDLLRGIGIQPFWGWLHPSGRNLRHRSYVTPVQKVIDMMEKMKEKGAAPENRLEF